MRYRQQPYSHWSAQTHTYQMHIHMHAHTRTQAHTHTHTHTHTDGLLFNGALLFFNERCSRSSLCCPPHYLSVFSLSILHSSALLYLHLPSLFFSSTTSLSHVIFLPSLLYCSLQSFVCALPLQRFFSFFQSCLILLFLHSLASSSFFICIFPPFVLLISLPSSFTLFTPFS